MPEGNYLASAPGSPRWLQGLAASLRACPQHPRSASLAPGTGPPNTSNLLRRGAKAVT